MDKGCVLYQVVILNLKLISLFSGAQKETMKARIIPSPCFLLLLSVRDTCPSEARNCAILEIQII